MNLKFLFFPFSLVAATVLSIWFIWPTWFDDEEGIVAIKKEIERQETELSNIKSRKNNLNSLKDSIDSNVADVSLTRKYYPEEKDTETMINEANYFASSAGVAITNFDVTILDSSKRRIRGGAAAFECWPSDDSVTTTAAPTQQEVASGIEESQVAITSVELTVVGGYEKIRDFTNKLQKMELINNVSNITIEKAGATEEELKEGVSPDTLKADIKVCFGHIQKPKIDPEGDFIKHQAFSSKTFDFGYVDKVKGEIYRSAAPIEIGATGKNNPFIP